MTDLFPFLTSHYQFTVAVTVKEKLAAPLGYEFGASLKTKDRTSKEGPGARTETILPAPPEVQEDNPEFQAEPVGGHTTVEGADRFTRPVTKFPIVPTEEVAPAVPTGTGRSCSLQLPVPGAVTPLGPTQSSVECTGKVPAVVELIRK